MSLALPWALPRRWDPTPPRHHQAARSSKPTGAPPGPPTGLGKETACALGSYPSQIQSTRVGAESGVGWGGGPWRRSRPGQRSWKRLRVGSWLSERRGGWEWGGGRGERNARIELGRNRWSLNPRREEVGGWRAFASGFLWVRKASERRAEGPAGEGATEPLTCLNF